MEQKVIKQMNNWLGNRVEAFSDEDLREMFLEISDFRRTGLLTGPSKLRKFEREFSDHVQNHNGYLRTVEDAVLFEMARRFYNQVIF